jgi:hypothetical protein
MDLYIYLVPDSRYNLLVDIKLERKILSKNIKNKIKDADE